MSNNDIDLCISHNLLKMQMVEMRKAKHITQKELANISGLSESCISNIESQNDSSSSPTLKSVMKYINALNGALYIRSDCNN